MRIRNLRVLVFCVFLLCAALSQLTAQTRTARGIRHAPTSPDRAVHALQNIDDCAGLRVFVAETILEAIVQSRYGMRYWWATPWSSPGGEVDGGAEPSDYTTTNVQEEGVDELDIVKTDGNFVYLVHNQELLVLDSWPAETAHVVSRFPLGANTSGLFIYQDKAVVISHFHSGGTVEPRTYRATRIDIVDLSDRSAPVLMRSFEVEGWMSGARLIDGQVYVVVATPMIIPGDAWSMIWQDDLGLPDVDWDTPEEERLAAAETARGILRPMVVELVAEMELADMLPLAWDSAGSAEVVPLLECSSLYHPAQSSSYAVLSVLHLDLDQNMPAGGHVDVTGVLADGWQVYASSRRLYVSQSSRWWGWWGFQDLNTAIHVFDLGTEQGSELRYRATGSVRGWLLNSFSMSEYEGVLRVATTEFDWWWGFSEEEDEDLGTRVTVLQDDGDGALVELGKVTGIAPGEQLQAARFMGDRGYLVTFERIDPLFTLDLADAENPQVVGELEIPGFSSYLHPMDEGYLLAVGMDGRDDGTITGLAVSIFDVRDMENPQRVHQYTIEDESGTWSSSEALWDHHAFTFHRGVLSIPAYISSYPYHGNFSGLVVMQADVDEGIQELGRIDHSDLPANPNGWDHWLVPMRRSLYIEDNLFSLSDRGVKVNDLNDPAIEYTAVPFY